MTSSTCEPIADFLEPRSNRYRPSSRLTTSRCLRNNVGRWAPLAFVAEQLRADAFRRVMSDSGAAQGTMVIEVRLGGDLHQRLSPQHQTVTFV
jgi:hypothetical protein